MCMLDTTDGALMMALYTSKAFSRDVVAILYYSIVLTGITVVVSAFIGVIQILSLAYNVAEPTGRFWDGVEAIGDHYDVIGGCICGLFVVVGLASVLIYRPWRKKMEDRMDARSILDVESPVASPAPIAELAGDGAISPYADSPVASPLVERVPERIV